MSWATESGRAGSGEGARPAGATREREQRKAEEALGGDLITFNLPTTQVQFQMPL